MEKQPQKPNLEFLEDKREELLNNTEWITCECGCGAEIKSKDAYGRPKSYVNGHGNRKYDDPKEYKRVYGRKRYTDPKLKIREQEKKKKYHHQRKAKLINHMGGKCNSCNLLYDGNNGAVFQFHHIDPSKKESRISMDWSWVRQLEEAKKCLLLCANCHFLLHGGCY